MEKNSSRVAKNTLYLYFRTLFVMCISIYTSRIVLEVLGVENYGIYNVVGGFVAMFSVLSGTLTAASQRYIAFELGKQKPQLAKVFSTTISIHFLLAFVIFILLESIGIWFLNNKMNIDQDRLFAANCVFQCSVITFCVSLVSIPYNAAIVAYEKMSVFAYISIFEVLAKLGAVYALFIIKYDSLIVYAIFMLVVAIMLRCIYGTYCNRFLKDCRYRLLLDKRIFKEMLGFCGWNFIGSSSAILNGQGINLLINLFFGVTLNAARGISSQVENAVNTFVQNFMMALNPQITKGYASQDYAYVIKLLVLGTKISFFLFGIICLPIFLNAEYILKIWLKNVPEYACLFVKLGLIYNLLQNLSQCLYTVMLASGKIKNYQLVVGGLSLLAFPATLLFFKMGLGPEWGYLSIIIFSIVCFIARLPFIKKMLPGFFVHMLLKKALIPIFFSTISVVVIAYFINLSIQNSSFVVFVLKVALIVFSCCIVVFFIGFSKEEKSKVLEIVKNKIVKKK